MPGVKIDLDQLDILNEKIWEYRDQDSGYEIGPWIGTSWLLIINIGLLIWGVVLFSSGSSFFKSFCLIWIMLLAALAGAIYYIKKMRTEKRKSYNKYHEMCRNLAKTLNLEYKTNEPLPLLHFLQPKPGQDNHIRIYPFPEGFIYDMMKGEFKENYMKVRDYSYWNYGSSWPDSGNKNVQYNWTILQADLDFDAFRLFISARSNRSIKALFDFEAAGLNRFEFEFDDFNQAFNVYCRDKRFAFDIIHPRIMEFLLRPIENEIQISMIELYGRSIMFAHEEFLCKSFILSFLDFAHEFLKKIPSYISKKKQLNIESKENQSMGPLER
jgi:hypothetical protein